LGESLGKSSDKSSGKSWRRQAIGGAAALGALAALVTVSGASAGPLDLAQGLFAPPSPVPDADGEQDGDRAGLLLRVERLEGDLRRANGAIEELQNQNERLADELKRFRDDVEFRLSGAKAPVASAAPAPAPAPSPAAAPPPRKNDAFDPNATPAAPGAPQALGATQPSAPLDLGPRVAEAPPPPAPAGPLKTPESGPTVIGSGLDFADGPRAQFNTAVEAYKAGQYQTAEDGFKAFLAANAAHKLTADAIFYLGESYLQRSRPREAAEQYLRLSTDYARSPRAPESMMRLGQSLAMLGNSEQACATFAEVSRRYPTAAASLKKNVEREMQKDHC
jgi:tol-pal system protein YbgF